MENYSIQATNDKEGDIPEFTEDYAKYLVDDMLFNGKLPSQKAAAEIFNKSYDIFRKLPNIVEINNIQNLILVGDVHGQFHDVAAIFKEHGLPSQKNPYLFNGDFVDRGMQGIEILMTLFAFKIACPNSIFLNRGNQFVFLEMFFKITE